MRAFIVEMIVLGALVVALIAGLHFTTDDWRANHIGEFGWFAVYALVVTQATYFLVAYTSTP
jgi:hypothetical protein